jgi:hypothetical protein
MRVVLHQMIDAFGGPGDENLIALLLEPKEGIHGIEHFGGIADDQQDFSRAHGASRVEESDVQEGRGKIVANAAAADDTPLVYVEFYGMARERAGAATYEVHARSLHEVVRAVESAFPRLDGLWASFLSGASPFRLSLDGQIFLSADQELLSGTKLLILGADAGG